MRAVSRFTVSPLSISTFFGGFGCVFGLLGFCSVCVCFAFHDVEINLVVF